MIEFSKYILLLIISLFLQKAIAQEYTFRNYQTKDGLPSIEVYHTIQDVRGYIWFATDNGVSRFDGYNFVNFDISKGLINNTVFDLYEDWKGRIWFIALSGRLCYYEDDEIKQFEFNQLIDANTTNRSVPVKRSFYVDSLDNVYLPITHQGTFKISKKGEITNLVNGNDSHILSIKKMTSDKHLMNFKSLKNAPLKLMINGKEINHAIKFPLYNSSIFFADEGGSVNELLFSIEKKIFKYSGKQIEQLLSETEDIIWFSKDNQNNYWLSVRNKGIKYFSSTDFRKTSDFWFLKDKDVSSVLVDDEGGYWFTTLNSGVFYLPSPEIKTVPLSSTKNSNCLSIAASPQNIYLGLEEKQIIKYDSKLKTIKETIKVKKSQIPLKLIYHNKFKELILGTYNFCSSLPDQSGSNLKQIFTPTSKHRRSDAAIKSLCKGNQNYYWAGTYSGLYKINRKQIIYQSNETDNWQEAVYAIIENNDKSLWLGTFNGLWQYKNGEYINYGIKNELLTHRINALHRNNNYLFIGTKGRGLLIVDLNDFSIEVISKENGLLSNSISSIVQYNNEIWIGTNNGVNKLVFFKNKLKSISRLDQGTGLVGNEINQLLIDNGILYIASRSGFNYVNLRNLKWTMKKPRLYIQNLKINYKDTILRPDYQLSSNENNIEISYVGISYKSNKNILYKYQLLPFDKDWKTTRSTSINYSSLSPGEYEFRIMAINESGTWSEINNCLKFRIQQPYYKKWWFYLICIIILVTAIARIFYIVLKKIKQENELRKELKQYAQKSIAAQLNPHFIFNSLNSLNYLILKNDKLESSKYLSKLSTYLRAVFDAVQKDKLTLDDEIKIISLYLKLEKSRLKEKLNYEIVLDNYIDSEEYKIPGLFILPLLERAIWKRIQARETAGFLKISIEKQTEFIQVLIEDNGIFGKEGELEDEEKKLEERKKLLNDFYQGQVIFDFISNTKVSFNDIGNIVVIKLLIKFH